MNPVYPVYVVSKGRWESRKTARALDKIGVDYKVVIEPQESDAYAAVIPIHRLLILPFRDRGCSVPARNWIWNHAVLSGAHRHWILDDNISGFFRLNRNLKTPVGDGTIFRAAEEFVDRFENVAEAGFNYFMFAPRKVAVPPLYLNTRIYSCILLKNDIPFRWRGLSNEDTDLSLRILKAGWCTVLFNAFLAFKQTTMTMKGGNMDGIYSGVNDQRLSITLALQRQHPDVVKVTRKWGRWQHHVDYSQFSSNRLKPKLGAKVEAGTNDFGMRLQQHTDGGWEDR